MLLNVRGARLLGDRYRLVERLGQGGMSQVWRGYDELLRRDVAVKILTPRFAGDQTVARRLWVEAQAVSHLSHPHITAVYDYGEAVRADGASVPYVVMELVDGEPLSARLAGRGLYWRDAVTVCAQVAAALAAAHAQGIVHRDVTPANVMLTKGGAKVVDFGISALTGERDVSPDGSLFGTPAYLAPERLDGGPVEPATDVYSLGLLLYKSLCGRLPWPVMNTTQMLRAHRLAEPAPLPRSIAAKVPAEIVQLCRRCLAKQPRDRPACDEVARTLATAVDLAVPLPEEEPVVALPSVNQLEETTLSWPAEPSARPAARPAVGTDAATGDGTGGNRRRNVTTVLLTLVLFTVAAWAGARSPDGNEPGEAAGVAAAPAVNSGQERRCRVDYRVRADWGNGFRARVAVTNQGQAPLRDWQLAFAFSGDQRVTAAAPATWHQSGHSVVARPTDAASHVDPGDRVEINLTGEYAQANPLPREFDVDGVPCQTVTK